MRNEETRVARRTPVPGAGEEEVKNGDTVGRADFRFTCAPVPCDLFSVSGRGTIAVKSGADTVLDDGGHTTARMWDFTADATTAREELGRWRFEIVAADSEAGEHGRDRL